MGGEQEGFDGLFQIARKVEKLHAEHMATLRAKERFNLFTVLRESDEETGLHSRYLAHLLNPNNKDSHHDCDALFLRLFLKTLRRGVETHDDQLVPLEIPDDRLLQRAKVEVEKVVPDGRLDIFIEIDGWGAIAIENKIWAGEQPEQLDRYAKYLKGRIYRNCVLLYLTPAGKQADTARVCVSDYRRISYRKHVLDWLDECVGATCEYVGINQALQQYRNVIHRLLGLNQLEAKYMANLEELLAKQPDVLRHWDTISRAVSNLRDEVGLFKDKNGLWKKFVLLLGQRLKTVGIDFQPDLSQWDGGQLWLETTSLCKGAMGSVLIRWQPGEDKLLLGVSALHPQRDRIFEQRWKTCRDPTLVANLRKVFDELKDECNDEWPLGYLVLQDDFMTWEFIADHVGKDNPTMKEFVDRVAGIVERYIRVISSHDEA